MMLNAAIAAYEAILDTGFVDYHLLNKLLKSLDTFNLLALEYDIDRTNLKSVITRTVKDEIRYIILSQSEYASRIEKTQLVNKDNVISLFRG